MLALHQMEASKVDSAIKRSMTHLTLGSTSVLLDVAMDGRRRVDATDGRRFETPESLTDAVGGGVGFTDFTDACETLCFLPRPNIL